MIDKKNLAMKKLLIFGFPFLLSFYMFLTGHVLAAAIYIASVFLFSAFSSYNLNEANLIKLSFLSSQDKKRLKQAHQAWPKKLGIGLGWLIAAIIYYGQATLLG